jgi:hypothetical protein
MDIIIKEISGVIYNIFDSAYEIRIGKNDYMKVPLASYDTLKIGHKVTYTIWQREDKTRYFILKIKNRDDPFERPLKIKYNKILDKVKKKLS